MKSLLFFCVITLVTVTATQFSNGQLANSADEALARKTMEYWKALIKENPKLLSDSNSALTLYRDAWGALDLEEAIKIDEEKAWHGHRLSLAARLAFRGMNQPSETSIEALIATEPSLDLELEDKPDSAAVYKRFGDLEKVMGRLDWPAYYGSRFWVRFAEIGLERNDREMVELAIRKFEAIAAATELETKSPPLEHLDIRAGRFFMAAAKLELERDAEKLNEEEIGKAIRLLQTTSRSFSPGSIWMSFYNLDEMRQFANLESYRREFEWNVAEAENKQLGNKILKPLVEFASPGYVWMYDIPKLENEVVNPWIVRQAIRGRADVALSFLLWAEGDPLIRARLMAVLAEQIATEKPKLAKKLNDVAIQLYNDDFVRQETAKSIGIIRDPNFRVSDASAKIETLAQIALAHDALGEAVECKHKTKQCLASFSRMITDDESEFDKEISPKEMWDKYTHKFDYECLTTIARATAIAGLQRDTLPKSFVQILSQTGNSSRLRRPADFNIRRVNYFYDVSPIVKLKDEFRYEEHMDYYKFMEQAKHKEAAFEVIRLAKGNPAWYSSLPEVVINSVRDLGLKSTLEWAKEIKNTGERLQVEAAAVRAVMDPKSRKILRRRDPYTPSKTVAPGIRWPTNGC